MSFRSDATHFKTFNIKRTHFGLPSIGYLRPKIWDYFSFIFVSILCFILLFLVFILPHSFLLNPTWNKWHKVCGWFNNFKNNNKLWNPNERPCRLYKKNTLPGYLYITFIYIHIIYLYILYICCIYIIYTYIYIYIYIYIYTYSIFEIIFPLYLLICFALFCYLFFDFWHIPFC